MNEEFTRVESSNKFNARLEIAKMALIISDIVLIAWDIALHYSA